MKSPEQIQISPETGWEKYANAYEKYNKPSSFRFRKILETFNKLAFEQPKIKGLEELLDDLKNYPPDTKIIFAVSHITDIDMPIALSTLAQHFDIKYANMSVHHNFTEEASTNIGLRISGKDRSFPIGYSLEKDGKPKQAKPFNPDDFTPMIKGLDENPLVIAAHNPAHDFKLPDKGGYGAPYLAAMAENSIIVPVSTDVGTQGAGMNEEKAKTFFSRPKSTITIGSPLTLEAIDNIDQFNNIFKKRKNHEQVTPEEIQIFKKVHKKLEDQSAIIMSAIAANEPLEKRGSWNKE